MPQSRFRYSVRAVGNVRLRDRGDVTGPAELTLRQQIVACTPQPGSLTPTKAFAMAEKLADHTGLPLVVVDPNGIWNPVWGELLSSNIQLAATLRPQVRLRGLRACK